MKVLELWKVIDTQHREFFCNLYEHYEYYKDSIDLQKYIDQIRKYIPEADSMKKRPFRVTFKCSDGSLKLTIIRGRKCLNFKPEILLSSSVHQSKKRR